MTIPPALRRLGPGALIGLLCAALAVGVGEAMTVFVRPAASPIIVVGNRVIALTPEPVRRWAIAQFGTSDKTALLTGIYVVIAVFAVLVGVLALSRLWFGLAGIVIFGAVGTYCAVTTNAPRPSDVIPTLVATAAALVAMVVLIRVVTGPGQSLVGSSARPLADRRQFLQPTALAVPQLDPATWKLRIHGLVDHPVTLTYADILARPLIERWITLACVSREVTGAEDNLIGNARFLGAPLADILREAGVQPGADQLVSRSSDGMTIGTPTAVVLDGRDAMLAVGMNGAPLPFEHGFPVRMVVPGLYGYVSACKWIVDIEATTFTAYDAYWVDAGWNADGPVVVSSRIDTPKRGQQLTIGQPIVVAGVAWEQHVGISKVEVQDGTGAWEPARLAPVPSIDTWQQWTYKWTPTTAGVHTLRVRATDRDGNLQSAKVAEPYPGPASGWAAVTVNVR